MQHDPKQYLLDAYLGEIGGEASFLALIDRLPEHEDTLRLLAKVESDTATALAPYLDETPNQSALADVQDKAQARMQKFKATSWAEMIEDILPIIEDALTRFIDAEQHAPSNLQGIYKTYTAHEQALADFLYLERDGKDGTRILRDYLDTLPR